LLLFNAALDFIWVEATIWLLIAIVLFFLDPHEIFLGDEDVGTLLLLIVELLD